MYAQIARFMGQHGAHLGPTGPRWAPCWPHELCYLGHSGTAQRCSFTLNNCEFVYAVMNLHWWLSRNFLGPWCLSHRDTIVPDIIDINTTSIPPVSPSIIPAYLNQMYVIPEPCITLVPSRWMLSVKVASVHIHHLQSGLQWQSPVWQQPGQWKQFAGQFMHLDIGTASFQDTRWYASESTLSDQLPCFQ